MKSSQLLVTEHDNPSASHLRIWYVINHRQHVIEYLRAEYLNCCLQVESTGTVCEVGCCSQSGEASDKWRAFVLIDLRLGLMKQAYCARQGFKRHCFVELTVSRYDTKGNSGTVFVRSSFFYERP